jgi:membrane protein DedA with SNARE-associated domain
VINESFYDKIIDMGLIHYFVALGAEHGTLGIFIGAILENIGVPFANSAQVLASGALIQNHKATFLGLIVAGTAGNIIGSSLGYGIGYFLGDAIRKVRHGFVFKKESEIHKFMDKYGSAGVFFAQLYGTTRTFVSIPAGMMKMNFNKFITYTTLGGLLFAIFVTLFSLIIRDAYYKYIFPFIGLSFGSAAFLFMILFLLTHFSYKYAVKLRKEAKQIFHIKDDENI